MEHKRKARVLLYDIETIWIEGGTWGIWEQDVVIVSRDWHLLSVAWKWLGDRQIHVIGLPDFPLYKKEPRNDIELVKKINALFNEADVVIAHNGDQFDQKKSQARMIIQGVPPPSPYLQIDTKKVAKKHFAFTSNKLDDLGEYLGVGHKLEAGGKYLWKNCIDGNMSAWRKMKKYNRQDVVLLEKVYLKLRPWMTTHPSVNLITGIVDGCPMCGSKNVQKRGFRYSKTNIYQRIFCGDCLGWSRTRVPEKITKLEYTT